MTDYFDKIVSYKSEQIEQNVLILVHLTVSGIHFLALILVDP